MEIISSEREDDLTIFFEPQASLPSAAQPAVMDIRRLRRRSGKPPFFSDIPFFSSFACDRTFYVRMSFWMGNALSSQPFALWLVAFGCFGIKFYRSGVADILLFLKQITCRCLGMWIFFTYIKKTAKNSYCLHNCLRKQRIVCTFASSKG